MADLTMSVSMSAGGVSVSGTIVRDCPSQIGHDPDLPAAQEGTLTTRTDDDTGVITLEDGASPSVIVNDRVTVYWTNADGTNGYRYNMLVTAVVGSTITLDGGAGDVLPALNFTEMFVAEEVRIDTDFDGDLVELIAASCAVSSRMHLRFDAYVGTDSTPLAEVLIPAGEAFAWWNLGAFTNPLANAVVGAMVVSSDSIVATTGNIAIGYNSVP